MKEIESVPDRDIARSGSRILASQIVVIEEIVGNDLKVLHTKLVIRSCNVRKKVDNPSQNDHSNQLKK